MRRGDDSSAPRPRRADPRRHLALAVIAFVGVGLLPPAASAVDPFGAALLPDTTFVDVNTIFTVGYVADDDAAQFNAYDLAVQWDPTILDLLSVQSGSLMNSGCGNTFHVLDQTDSTFSWSHTLLCLGISLDGPGELCEITFRGKIDGMSTLEILTSPNCAFFDAGVCINASHPTLPRDVTLTGAVVMVGDVATSAVDAPVSLGTALRFAPNPTRGPGVFIVHTDANSAWRLEVFDAAGRRVATLPGGAAAGPVHRVPWSGVSAAGDRLPAGVYYARLQGDEGAITLPVVLIR